MPKTALNLFLILLALVLLIILYPISIPFFLISRLRKQNKTRNYFRKIAFSIDCIGNVMLADMFNILLLKDVKYYPFGNLEPPSKVLGNNKQIENLTILGLYLSKTIDFFDENHIDKSKRYI